MSGQWLNFIFLPLIGAFLGWMTFWAAVKLLFHPREARTCFGLKLQGVIPKRRPALISKLSDLVVEHIFSGSEFSKGIDRDVLAAEISTVLDGHFDRVLLERLPRIIPALAMFMTPDLAKTIKSALQEDVKLVVMKVLDTVGPKLGSVVDVHAIVRRKAEALSDDRVEKLCKGILETEFRCLKWACAAMGFLIGIAQAVITRIPL